MYLVVKRILDLIFSFVGLLVLSPLFLIIAILIKIDSSGPVLFRQSRVGKNKKPFNIYKFRTMQVSAPANTPTHQLKNSNAWITRVGKVLRLTSLDELPQLINIIKGDMSIIGPRPALWNQYDLIAERDKYGANNIAVGLTGWAQVNGRDEIDISHKAKLDGDYVANMGIIMDIKCFALTVVSVIKHKGVSEGDS